MATETEPAAGISAHMRGVTVTTLASLAGVAAGVVLVDAAYGNDTQFRTDVTDLGLGYVMGVRGSTTVWPPGRTPLPPKPWSGRGRPTSRLRRDADHQPMSAKDLAMSLDADVWTTLAWREGTDAPLASRFATARVRPAHRERKRGTPRPEEWLLVEWPEGEAEPAKYWLSGTSNNAAFGLAR